MKKAMSDEKKAGIVRKATAARDVMAHNHQRIPLQLLTGDYQDWIDESNVREGWIASLEAAGVTLHDFVIYAMAAVRHGLLVLSGGAGVACGGGYWDELLLPGDFNDRVHRFLNPCAAKPAKKKKPQQTGLFA